MKRMIIFLGVLLATSACQTASTFDTKGKKAMTTQELTAAFVGNTVSGESGSGTTFTKKYYPDGKLTISGVSRRTYNWNGKWAIRDNMICSEYTNGRGGCRKYYRDGNEIYRAKEDGTADGSVSIKKGI